MKSPYKYKVSWDQKLLTGALIGMTVKQTLRHVTKEAARAHAFQLADRPGCSNITLDVIL